MSTGDKYFDEWSEYTNILWWKKGRQKLNSVIRIVNAWTLDGCSLGNAEIVLRCIDMGRQTFGAEEGGHYWDQCLLAMHNYVSKRIADKRSEDSSS